MRAIVYDRYGGPEVLRMDELPVPTPAAEQVLVRVAATGVNLSDWEFLRGRPLYARSGGPLVPARRVLGSDIAGTVEAVGGRVTRWRPGDEVYADNLELRGGFAEYALVPAAALAEKPAALTFVQAAALPQSGAIATQGTARARAGARVLINGAGGGSGSFAVQLAKRAGAHVTGVDHAPKLAYLRALGADVALDAAEHDFTERGPFDLVLDLVAQRSTVACLQALARGGHYLAAGGSTVALLRLALLGPVLGALTGKRAGVMAVRTGPRAFQPLAELCVQGDVAIHIDSVFELDAVPDALRRVGEGRALGKVVVEVRR